MTDDTQTETSERALVVAYLRRLEQMALQTARLCRVDGDEPMERFWECRSSAYALAAIDIEAGNHLPRRPEAHQD